MTNHFSELLTKLQEAVNGLQWISDSESPFEVFHWQQQAVSDLSDEQLLELTSHTADTLVESLDVDTFFAWVTEEQDWQSEAEKAAVNQYQQLIEILKQELSNLQVYRVGEVNVDIYVVGITPEGTLAGISTKSVET